MPSTCITRIGRVRSARDSTIEGYSSHDTVRWKLSQASLRHLRHHPFEFVAPGGVPFGTILQEHLDAHQESVSGGSFFEVVGSPDSGADPVEPPSGDDMASPRTAAPVILVSPIRLASKTRAAELDLEVSVVAVAAKVDRVVAEVLGAREAKLVNEIRDPEESPIQFPLTVPLDIGPNQISVRATDRAGGETAWRYTIEREQIPAKLVAVVFGAQAYENVPQLKHALADARAIRDLLIDLGVSEERMYYEPDPKLADIKRGLGTWLPRHATDRRDVVFVYFAGHGAAEAGSRRDPDGFAKYLLPVDADLGDLYSTAFPMSGIHEALGRNAAGTQLVILDACFSGAAGGRVAVREGERLVSGLTEDFLDAFSGGGVLFWSASGANEPAQERSNLGTSGHGLFTYYVLKGLEGEANVDKDDQVLLAEVVGWVRDVVRRESASKQTPSFHGRLAEPLPLVRLNGKP